MRKPLKIRGMLSFHKMARKRLREALMKIQQEHNLPYRKNDEEGDSVRRQYSERRAHPLVRSCVVADPPELTNTRMDQQTRKALLKSSRALAGLAGLVLIGVILQLTGCATAPTDQTEYNPRTGFPVVGSGPWGPSL